MLYSLILVLFINGQGEAFVIDSNQTFEDCINKVQTFEDESFAKFVCKVQ